MTDEPSTSEASTSTRRTFVRAVGSAGALGITATAGCVGGGGSGGDTYTIGYSNFTNGIPFEVMVRLSFEWYGEDSDTLEVQTTAADGTTSQQIEDCRNLLRQDIDALIVTPTDSNGLASIAEEADVPVFSADIPINSEDVAFHVGVNQQQFGFQSGQQLVEVMRDRFGDADKKVLEIMMDQDNSNAVLRHRYFNQAIDEHDDVEVTKQIEIDGYDATNVADLATSWLQSDPDVHGVFAPWTGGPIGVLRAFEQNDMKVPKDEEGHIPIVSCDANAAIIDEVNAGYIDQVMDQPVTFYGPLALHYVEEYLDADGDPEVLPRIGGEVTADDLTIEESTHLDTAVWQDQRWAPATIREFVTFNGDSLGFPFFTTNIPIVTEDNADAPYIWGNLTRET